jgi:endoglucanase
MIRLPFSRFCLFFACLASSLGQNPAFADPVPLTPFPDHTRYAAIGDSITHNGWYLPYVDLYYLTRFPKQKLDTFNCGINGDTVDGGMRRYSWDIAPHQPTVASLMFGMNDIGRDDYAVGKSGPDVEKSKQTHIDNYERNLSDFVHLLQKDKIQVILILPSIFDDTAAIPAAHYPGLNDGLGECAKRAQKVADENGCAVIDFYHPMLKITLEKQATDPKFSMIGPDRVHPTVLGQLFMAYLFLKAQNVPADVARVSIKGSDGTVAQAVNCQIDGNKVENGAVTFRYSANALPFPIEKWTSAATTWAPFVDDLDREIFQVTDLPAGTWQLTIDHQPIRTYTAAELGAGVNLATEGNTPQARQAQKVWNAYKERQDLVFRLRTIASVERAAFAPNAPHPATLEEMQPLLDAYLKSVTGSPWEKAIDGEVAAYRLCKARETDMQAKIDTMLDAIRALAQPQPHEVKITPVPATASAPAGT